MDGKPDKPHRIRVRTCDGKPRDARELNRLRSNQLGMPHLDIFQTDTPTELIICASIEDHIKAVRNKLAGAGLEEIANGNTTITTEDRMKTVSQPSQQGARRNTVAGLRAAADTARNKDNSLPWRARRSLSPASPTGLSHFRRASTPNLQSGTTARAAKSDFQGRYAASLRTWHRCLWAGSAGRLVMLTATGPCRRPLMLSTASLQPANPCFVRCARRGASGRSSFPGTR